MDAPYTAGRALGLVESASARPSPGSCRASTDGANDVASEDLKGGAIASPMCLRRHLLALQAEGYRADEVARESLLGSAWQGIFHKARAGLEGACPYNTVRLDLLAIALSSHGAGSVLAS